MDKKSSIVQGFDVKKFFVFCFCVLFCYSAHAAQNLLNRSVHTKVQQVAKISNSDLNLYKSIFKNIEKEHIEEARKQAKKIDNQILMGHVWAQIYLSKSYKSTADELKKWLRKYPDFPQLRAIYNLAVSKAGRDAVDNPWGEKYPVIYSPYSWFNNQYEDLSPENRSYVRRQVSAFRRFINKGQTKAARGILETRKFRMTIPDHEYDAMSVTLATMYLLDNQNKLAWQWVQKAANRSHLAMAYWIGGLAAWRLKNYKNSASFFAKLGAKEDSDEWLVAAGRYWAYRAYSRAKNKAAAQKWLHAAAVYKRTFYGMLAAYQLGIPWNLNWNGAAFVNDYSQDAYLQNLLESQVIRRILLLLQIDNKKLAEKEIRVAYPHMTKQQKEALLFIAQQYKMHAVAILLANDIKDNEGGVFYDEAAYPVPQWKPKDGWKVNRAFVWALVRQESAFFPKANSRAGAKGLMQLMPATAFHITKNPAIKKDSKVLFKSDYNLMLGQRYVSYLAEKSFIDKNMFFVITAYNAGPGNLHKWLKKVQYNNDPLLFIEVIPARETRIYIERVMANYWMYEARFGRKHKSLEALVKGQWPKL